MPLGEPICALRASGRRTSGNACGSWHTPVGASLRKEAHNKESGRLKDQARLASWATPAGRDWKSEAGSARTPEHQKKHTPQLNFQARLAGWPSPNATDTIDRQTGMSPSRIATNRKTGYLTEAIRTYAAPWPTPHSNSGTGAGTQGREGGMNLQTTAAISGPPANGSPAGTGNTGQLNSAFSLWLMGYPAGYLD